MSLVPYKKRSSPDLSSDESMSSDLSMSDDSMSDDSMSDDSMSDEDDAIVVRAPRSSGARVHKSQDGQYSIQAPKVSSVEDAARHGFKISYRDLNTGCVYNGMAIGVARQKGIETKRKRSALLKQLKEGRVTLADIVNMTTQTSSEDVVVAGKIRVKSLLQNLPSVARTKMKEIIVLSQVDPLMTMRQLCSAQHRRVLMRLVRVLEERVPALRGRMGLRVERE